MTTALPSRYLDQVPQLTPYQASLLVSEITEIVAVRNSMNAGVFEKRKGWIEKYMGLYGPDMTLHELSERLQINYTTVKKASKKLPENFLLNRLNLKLTD